MNKLQLTKQNRLKRLNVVTTNFMTTYNYCAILGYCKQPATNILTYGTHVTWNCNVTQTGNISSG